MDAIFVALMLTMLDLIIGCGLAALLDRRQFAERKAGLLPADPIKDMAFRASRTRQ